MNRKKRRALLPHETAKVDQIQASLRDESIREADSCFYLLRFSAAREVQCCWCDCPPEDHQIPGYICGGCPDSAVYAADQLVHGARYTYPLCHRHFQDYRDEYMGQVHTHAKSSEIRTYDAYDKDLA